MKAWFPVSVVSFFLLSVGVASAEMRTWTSAADASKTFEAEFRGLSDDTVDFLTKQGQLIKVRLDILSEADREFIKTVVETEKAKEEALADASALGDWELTFVGKRGRSGGNPADYNGVRKIQVSELDGDPVITGRLFQNGKLSASKFEPGSSFKITETYRLGKNTYEATYSGKVSEDGTTIEDGKFRHVMCTGEFTGTKKVKK